MIDKIKNVTSKYQITSGSLSWTFILRDIDINTKFKTKFVNTSAEFLHFLQILNFAVDSDMS